MGGDWLLIDDKGIAYPDVRQTFHTDDDAYIQVFESGATQPDNSTHVRLQFETGSEKYAWMNTIVAVGLIHQINETDIYIDTWEVSVHSSRPRSCRCSRVDKFCR
jgi:hypothetical protein